MKIGDKVIDVNGYAGIVTNLFPETGQVQVQQLRHPDGTIPKCRVFCTYDNEKQLMTEETQG